MMGTQAVSRGAYSIKTVALAFNFLKTCLHSAGRKAIAALLQYQDETFCCG